MEQENAIHSFIASSAAEIGINLDSSQVEKFAIYLRQLQQWNKTINLTSITDEKEIVVKHFVDSLAGLQAERIEQGARIIDIGAGAGFPGIPLKIARPDIALTLVEPVKKKTAFLLFIIGLLHLEHSHVYEGTIEQFLKDSSPNELFDYAILRAIKYEAIARKCACLLGDTGKMIFYLSKHIDHDQLGSGLSIVSEYPFDLSHGFGKRVISVLKIST